MANCCSFELRAECSRESIEKFKELGHQGVFRVYEFEPFAEAETPDGKIVVQIYGTCAWSVLSSFIHDREPGMSLPELSRSLNLNFEWWSEEEGFEFEEHGLIRNGEYVIDDCFHVEWHSFYPEDGLSFEDWLKEEGLDGKGYTEKDLDENNEIIVGYKEWDFQLGESVTN